MIFNLRFWNTFVLLTVHNLFFPQISCIIFVDKDSITPDNMSHRVWDKNKYSAFRPLSSQIDEGRFVFLLTLNSCPSCCFLWLSKVSFSVIFSYVLCEKVNKHASLEGFMRPLYYHKFLLAFMWKIKQVKIENQILSPYCSSNICSIVSLWENM